MNKLQIRPLILTIIGLMLMAVAPTKAQSVTGNTVETTVDADDAVLYVVHDIGSLGWYRHLDRLHGTARFANGGRERVLASGQNPGDGWSGFKSVIAGEKGVLYGIKPNGTLVWYRHEDWESGGGRFANGGGERVLAEGQNPGDGWAGFKSVISGGNGVLYGIKPNGTLVWYRHEDWESGGGRFANGGRERVLAEGRNPGDGWSSFKFVMAVAPTQGQMSQPVQAQCSEPTAPGNWVNIDANTISVTRINIWWRCVDTVACPVGQSCVPPAPYELHIFGKCYPTDCVWSPVEARTRDGWIRATIEKGWVTQHV